MIRKITPMENSEVIKPRAEKVGIFYLTNHRVLVERLRHWFLYLSVFSIVALSLIPLNASDPAIPTDGGVDFLIIGGVKCGTSSLFHYMKKHPNIRTGPKKELHFFNKQYAKSNYDKGMDWYLSQFPKKEPGGIFFLNGEASAGYFENPLTAAEVAQYFPSVKLIILLRNPVDRALSQYKMAMRLGQEHDERSHEIIFAENMIKYECNPSVWDRYIYAGVYTPLIQAWRKFFPDDQIHIICSEDLFSNSDKIVNEVYDFL